MDERTRRWLAAFARRAIPAVPDAGMLSAPAEALEAATIVWRRRLLNEELSVDLAAALRTVAEALEVDRAILAALDRLAQDEARHVAVAASVLNAFGRAPGAKASLPIPDGCAEERWARLVLTGLCVCETVSAARFAAVRDHIDLPAFRTCIDAFHRDERAHGELGFVLLPGAITGLRTAAGTARATKVLLDELSSTLAELDRIVGLRLERRGPLPQASLQPRNNPGVVEPLIDAHAFYSAVHKRLLPRLESLGVHATAAWDRVLASPQ